MTANIIATLAVVLAASWAIQKLIEEVELYLESTRDGALTYTREDAIAQARRLSRTTSELWTIKRVSRFNSRYWVTTVR